jgi:hypothetical protein
MAEEGLELGCGPAAGYAAILGVYTRARSTPFISRANGPPNR